MKKILIALSLLPSFSFASALVTYNNVSEDAVISAPDGDHTTNIGHSESKYFALPNNGGTINKVNINTTGGATLHTIELNDSGDACATNGSMNTGWVTTIKLDGKAQGTICATVASYLDSNSHASFTLMGQKNNQGDGYNLTIEGAPGSKCSMKF